MAATGAGETSRDHDWAAPCRHSEPTVYSCDEAGMLFSVKANTTAMVVCAGATPNPNVQPSPLPSPAAVPVPSPTPLPGKLENTLSRFDQNRTGHSFA